LNDATRAWSKRLAERAGGRMPTMNHAGVYSSELAYLRAAKSMAGWTDAPSGSAVAAKMAEAPIDDALFAPTTPQGRPRRARHVLRSARSRRRVLALGKPDPAFRFSHSD
jgi:branched-chain amino acid transport system substrate-binding protein